MTEISLYADRRARLAAQLGAGGIAIIPTAREQQRNRDSDFLFRHDSYFYYLTGFTEPNAWLVLTAEGEATLFCQPKDLEREIWDGIRLGPDAAPAELGVHKALPVTELATQMPKLLETAARSGTRLPHIPGWRAVWMAGCNPCGRSPTAHREAETAKAHRG